MLTWIRFPAADGIAHGGWEFTMLSWAPLSPRWRAAGLIFLVGLTSCPYRGHERSWILNNAANPPFYTLVESFGSFVTMLA